MGYIQVDYDGFLRRRDEATEGIATSYLYSELIELNSTLLEIKSLINDSEFGLTRITYKDREGDLSELENNLYTIISFPESFKAEFSEMDTDFHIEFNEAVNLLSEVSMEDIRLDLGKTDLVLVLNDGHENTATGEQTYITSKMQIGDGWLQDGIKITDFLGYDGQNKGIAYTRYVEGFTDMLYIPELAGDENANIYLSEYLAENADVIRNFTHRADFENTKIQPLRDVVAETLEAVSLGILPIIEGELRYDIIRGEKISSREAIWYEIEGSIDVGSAFLAAAGGAKLTKIVGEELLQAVAGEGTAYVAYECGASDTPAAVLNMTARIATGTLVNKVRKPKADFGEVSNEVKVADDLDIKTTNLENEVLIEGSTGSTKPLQEHHFATNKSKKYTSQFENIANKYNLDLDGAWNKELMPHQGRHPNAYHDYVLDNMQKFDKIAQGDQTKFLKLYDQMKQKIISNPDMLYKNHWINQ